MRQWKLWVLAGFVGVAGGCGPPFTAVAATHAANFGCAPPEVRVDEVVFNANSRTGTFLALGCGFRQVYFCRGNDCGASGVPIRLGPSSAGGEVVGRTEIGCSPPCSPGYLCGPGGRCEPICNPLCEAGYVCSENRTCEPSPAWVDER
jgi:hypothetical protein